jgi:hypothetical protein
MKEGKKVTFYALFRDSGWWVVGEIMKKAMTHEGFEVEISWNTRVRRLTEVANGHIDFGIIEETALYWAFHGIAQDEGHAILDLRAIANISQVFWLPFAVTHETRLTSIEQIKERKFPLRILTPHATVPGGLGSYLDCPGFLTEKIFEAYRFTLQDIERWGGEALDKG